MVQQKFATISDNYHQKQILVKERKNVNELTKHESFTKNLSKWDDFRKRKLTIFLKWIRAKRISENMQQFVVLIKLNEMMGLYTKLMLEQKKERG